jgi:hypothetical protein
MARQPRRGGRFLLATLILLLLFFPVLEDMARPILLTAAIAAVFVAGVIAVDAGPEKVRTAVALAAIQIALALSALILPLASSSYICTIGFTLASMAVLIIYCIYCVLDYVLQARYITRDQIYAGICVYLMLGFAFGCIYYLISMLKPDCFAINSTHLAGLGSPDLMYFSFVTLATLGYGDITPVAAFARALAELEALAGMLYMAVFMARLVTLVGSDNNLQPPTRSASVR